MCLNGKVYLKGKVEIETERWKGHRSAEKCETEDHEIILRSERGNRTAGSKMAG